MFANIGCNICHMESFTTQQNVTLRTTNGGKTAVIPSLSNVTFNPYSDFLLHDMGSVDSGGIPFQPHGTGQASLTMWRTSPLWGLSNVLAKSGGLMHDNTSTHDRCGDSQTRWRSSDRRGQVHGAELNRFRQPVGVPWFALSLTALAVQF